MRITDVKIYLFNISENDSKIQVYADVTLDVCLFIRRAKTIEGRQDVIMGFRLVWGEKELIMTSFFQKT